MIHGHGAAAETLARPAAGIGFFEKWLSVWVALCIGAGLVLGSVFPAIFETLAAWEYASVNLVVAALIWAMVYPMMVAVDFASLRRIGDRPKGLVITVVVNWLVKPFTMAALGVLFFKVIYAGLIPPGDAQQYIAGLILLGAAPCTAMVFVWSQLTRGDPIYTLVQVSLNDVIMIFAFAPIVALLLGVTDLAVPWETLLLSVGLYILVPLAAGALTRAQLTAGAESKAKGEAEVARFAAKAKPYSCDGGPAVRVSGRGDPRPASSDRADRGAAADPVLRDIRGGLWSGMGMAGAIQRGRAVRPDRHFELLRTRRGGCDQPVRPEQRCRARHRGRRAGRGSGDVVARRLRQPDPGLFPEFA